MEAGGKEALEVRLQRELMPDELRSVHQIILKSKQMGTLALQMSYGAASYGGKRKVVQPEVSLGDVLLYYH